MVVASGDLDRFYSFYLWHLHHAGVLGITPVPEPGVPIKGKLTFDDALWSELMGSANPRIAIIDNGVSTLHPNLPAGTIVASVDLATHPYGATYETICGSGDQPTETPVKHFLDLDLHKLGLEGDGCLADIATELRENWGVRRVPGAYSEEFCPHGTACAGLVAGRWLKPREGQGDPAPIRYYGVDPEAEIIAVNTPFGPEIKPIIAGILYALMHRANAILLPRTVYDARSRKRASEARPCEHEAPGDKDASKAPPFGHETRIDRDQRLLKQQKTFERLLDKVVAKMPVIVAAGNGGLDELEYPASLASKKKPKIGSNDKNDPADREDADKEPWIRNLIVVGAVNAKKKPSSYNSGLADVTLLAPSDDAETLHAGIQRLDADGRRVKDHGLAAGTGWPMSPAGEPGPTDFSDWTVLAIHVGGPENWRLGDRLEEVPTPTHGTARTPLYVPFGGTSAACSLTAGVVSLLQRAKWKYSCGGTQLHAAEAIEALRAGSTSEAPSNKPLLNARKAVDSLKDKLQTPSKPDD